MPKKKKGRGRGQPKESPAPQQELMRPGDVHNRPAVNRNGPLSEAKIPVEQLQNETEQSTVKNCWQNRCAPISDSGNRAANGVQKESDVGRNNPLSVEKNSLESQNKSEQPTVKNCWQNREAPVCGGTSAANGGQRESDVSRNNPSSVQKIPVELQNKIEQPTVKNCWQNRGEPVSVGETRTGNSFRGCRGRGITEQQTVQLDNQTEIFEDFPIKVPALALSASSQNLPSTSGVQQSSLDLGRRESRGVVAVDMTKRPNFGRQGRPIVVVSNYFLLKGEGNYMYHYDVEITDPSLNKNQKAKTIKNEKKDGATQLEIQQKRNVGKQKCREVINQLIKVKSLQHLHPVYDGNRNLYTFGKLPIKGKASATVDLSDGVRKKSYTITVQPAGNDGTGNIIDLESLNEICTGRLKKIPLEAVTVFDLILCHRDPQLHQVSVGRSFFSFTEMRKDPLDCGVEIWKGFNQSLHLTQRGPAVLVNVATKAFHSSAFVIDHACNILGYDITERRLHPGDFQKLTKSLKGVKVEVTHLKYPKKYTVESVTKQGANNLLVDIGCREMSVAQYFEEKYKRLKFPHLPCLQMKKTTRIPTYTPMEVCFICPGQPKLGKLDPKQTSDMINRTAIPPEERFESILNYAQRINETSGSNIARAGFEMQLTPVTLTARVISPPALAYRNQPPVQPDTRGVWRIDGKNFSEVSGTAPWILISFASSHFCPDNMLDQLSKLLIQASRGVGVHLDRPLSIDIYDHTTTTYNALRDAKARGVQFVLAILSRRDKAHSYDELKFFADVKLGLITQCMEDAVVKKCCEGQGAGQILNNLLSKLNVKLGGINHKFCQQPSVSMRKTIVMGADAAHSPRGSRCPSIAAVVGSVDDVPFQYAVSCKIQKNPDETKLSQEIILDMKEMTKHILNCYRNRNRCFPEKIVFFRDGVSQGQFQIVLMEELTRIQDACHELLKRVLPVTFIVVQKRHQTRFRPQNPKKDGVGRGENVPPGTTVDTDVTHPVHFDYFLCSHEGIKGTSKPAHYVILHDDNKFHADELQRFCYDLCHVYARCNRSISIPAPAMNAHLAAARAKSYIDWHLSKDGSSSGGAGNDSSLPKEIIDSVNNISDIKAPMFFV